MDSIFEEEADEVGGEIEAYCPSARCKADTTHTIISMYEDEVRRVQCVVCGEVHAYRKPRGDETAEDSAAKRAGTKRLTWEDALSRASETDLGNCRPYSIRDAYEEGDVVHHPVFDVGFVTELLPDNKVEVIFRDGGSRILVHNRGDLASRMPDISEIPVPREAKKKKRAKKPEAAPVPAVVRNKAEVEAAVLRARGAAQSRMDESQKTADQRSQKLTVQASKKAKPVPVAAKPAVAAKVVAAPVAAKSAKPVAAPAKGAKGAAPTAAPAKPAAKVVAKTAAVKAPTKPAKAAKPAPAKKAAPAAKKPAAKPAAKKPAAKPVAKKPAPAKKPAKPAPKKKKKK